ncbi:MAG: serine/threonine protein kinase [Deltaproteobacteria bacterium]|nr:serine/threonine protein kinase [Deltaproteobacteria bacterium]MBN2673914.1 serine/threonine protein kinase [Deltaproteobacteria bacterium]
MTNELIGKEILGQFRIVEKIGRGGMGEVYKAEQPAMDRVVAIKILHQKLAGRQDLVSRFRREARAMSRLSHPNTVRVFLYGQLDDTGQLYIAMEYLEGMDLAKHTRMDGPMEHRRAAKIMIQVLGALEEAHDVGVIHRDLKPENILLTCQGGIEDTPKVLDFGLAKIHDQKMRPGSMVLTRQGMVFGTPEFMSPEQARGEELDARSDIYSVGIIMYEMLTGRLPFPRCKPMEYITHQINTPPIPITERKPELNLPKELDAIIGKALEKDRNDRYQTAAEFAQALQALLPIEEQSGPMHAVPHIEKSITHSINTSKEMSSVEPTPATKNQGKGLVVALLAIIAVLLAVVIWLLATDNQKSEGVVVPTQPISAPAD